MIVQYIYEEINQKINNFLLNFISFSHEYVCFLLDKKKLFKFKTNQRSMLWVKKTNFHDQLSYKKIL